MLTLTRLSTAAIAAVMLLGAPAFAGASITGKPKVVFHAEGSPGFLTFDGVTSQITLTDDGASLVFTVPIDTVTTGIALRDDHMRRNYVETDKFPNVVLTVPRGSVQWPSAGAETNGTVQGRFEAHGVAKVVPITYSIKATSTGHRVKASFPFNTSEHGIAIPSYLGVTIDPAMTAEVQLDLQGS